MAYAIVSIYTGDMSVTAIISQTPMGFYGGAVLSFVAIGVCFFQCTINNVDWTHAANEQDQLELIDNEEELLLNGKIKLLQCIK